MLLYFKPRWKYSYDVIYLFWETCHLHLAARREPGLSSLWLTQCWVCASPCLCEPVGWCSRTQTPTSCCVDPAPPVVQSASAPDVHTSSVSFQPVCPPASLAHTPSNYIRDGQTEEYQNRAKHWWLNMVQLCYASSMWKRRSRVNHFVWLQMVSPSVFLFFFYFIARVLKRNLLIRVLIWNNNKKTNARRKTNMSEWPSFVLATDFCLLFTQIQSTARQHASSWQIRTTGFARIAEIWPWIILFTS